MDKLKKHLREQRDEMDIDMPGSDLWERIEQSPAAKKKATIYSIRPSLWYAIAACLLLAIGVKWIFFPGTVIPAGKQEVVVSKVPKQSLENTTPKVMSAIPEEEQLKTNPSPSKKKSDNRSIVQVLEDDYTKLVNMQLAKIRRIPLLAGGPDYFSSFKDQLKQMDIDEQRVRNDIRMNAPDAVLLEKLITIYQQKLNLLKELHMEIIKMNDKIQQQLPEDSLRKCFLNI